MPSIDKSTAITSVLQEKRVFAPPKEFSARSHIKSLAHYRKLYNESVRSPEKFQGRQAKNELVWFKPWKKVLQWNEPFARWFAGGQLNLSCNCIDKWLGTATANKAALLWEGEPACEVGTPVGRPRTLQTGLLERGEEQLLHRRRLPAGRGRIFL